MNDNGFRKFGPWLRYHGKLDVDVEAVVRRPEEAARRGTFSVRLEAAEMEARARRKDGVTLEMRPEWFDAVRRQSKR